MRLGGDRLAVGDLRLADVGADLELAHQAVDDDLEVQLAHAGDDRLAGLLVGADPEGRILLRQLAAAPVASFSWSALVLGSMATEMTGSGKSIDSSRIGVLGIAERVAGASPSLRPTAAAMSPAQTSSTLFALVGVHLEQPADRAPSCRLATLSTVSPVAIVPE